MTVATGYHPGRSPLGVNILHEHEANMTNLRAEVISAADDERKYEFPQRVMSSLALQEASSKAQSDSGRMKPRSWIILLKWRGLIQLLVGVRVQLVGDLCLLSLVLRACRLFWFVFVVRATNHLPSFVRHFSLVNLRVYSHADNSVYSRVSDLLYSSASDLFVTIF